MTVAIREATPDDQDFVIATARRLVAFGPPPWRSALEVVEREVRTLDDFFDGRIPGSALFVAGDEAGARLGFAFLETAADYFTGERHGHLGMLAVTEGAEGHGAAAALMGAAEEWTRARGFSRLTLNVFAGNTRARAFYERLSFNLETLRYVKDL